MGNDGHVTDVDALVHELTDLMNMLAMLVSSQGRPTYFFDGEAVGDMSASFRRQIEGMQLVLEAWIEAHRAFTQAPR